MRKSTNLSLSTLSEIKCVEKSISEDLLYLKTVTNVVIDPFAMTFGYPIFLINWVFHNLFF